MCVHKSFSRNIPRPGTSEGRRATLCSCDGVSATQCLWGESNKGRNGGRPEAGYAKKLSRRGLRGGGHVACGNEFDLIDVLSKNPLHIVG